MNNNIKKMIAVQKSTRYQECVSFENCCQLIDEIREELFDGIFLSLKGSAKDKRFTVQKRVLRRIVEKRQAQKVDRLDNPEARFKHYLTVRNKKRCLNSLEKTRMCC